MKKILFIITLSFVMALSITNVKAIDMTDKIAVSDGLGGITTVTKKYHSSEDYNEINVKLELTKDSIDDVLVQTPGSGASLGMFYFTLNPGITLTSGETVKKQNNYFKNDVSFETASSNVVTKFTDDDISSSPTVWIMGLSVNYYDGTKFVRLSTKGNGSKSIKQGLMEQLNCTETELVYGQNYNFSMYTNLYYLYVWEKQDTTREFIKVSYTIDFPVMGTKNGITTNFFTIDDALDAGETDIVVTDDFTLDDAITIPKGTTLEVRGGKLTLGEHGSIVNNGTFIGSYTTSDNKNIYSINETLNKGGITTFSKIVSESGTIIKFENKPNDTYKIKSLKVLNDYTDEDVTSILKIDENSTSFTMPNYPVRFVYEYEIKEEIKNPDTSDNIINNVITLSISLVSLIGITIYLNKKI